MRAKHSRIGPGQGEEKRLAMSVPHFDNATIGRDCLRKIVPESGHFAE